MDDPAPIAKPPSRAAVSCTACQRRKQKCSREWPCDKCCARNVAHLCEFLARKARQRLGSSPKDDAAQQKRRLEEEEEEDDDDDHMSLVGEDDPADGLEFLGYTKDDGIAPTVKASAYPENSKLAQTTTKVLPAVPKRELCDDLVQNFLGDFNYRYFAIYPLVFMEAYGAWWAAGDDTPRSPSFTCLLLRVLACSCQYPTRELAAAVEAGLDTSCQGLTERLHAAADELAAAFRPGEGDLQLVQQLFHAVVWLKAESRFVEAWHVCASAVKLAQELGMHREHPTDREAYGNFGIEQRRRVWCLLYVTDWQMSNWVSRPLIIDHRKCSYQPPNLFFNAAGFPEGAPSPITPMALLYDLAVSLSDLLKNESFPLNERAIFDMQSTMTKWTTTIHEKHPIYSLSDPDLSLDRACPWLPTQRANLRTLALMIKRDPLKAYLHRAPRSLRTPADRALHALAIGASLDVVRAARALFDREFPIFAKFHLVVFCALDAAVYLCSALKHSAAAAAGGGGGGGGRARSGGTAEGDDAVGRKAIVDALADAYAILAALAAHGTETGVKALKILHNFIAALPLLGEEHARFVLPAGVGRGQRVARPPERRKKRVEQVVSEPLIGSFRAGGAVEEESVWVARGLGVESNVRAEGQGESQPGETQPGEIQSGEIHPGEAGPREGRPEASQPVETTLEESLLDEFQQAQPLPGEQPVPLLPGETFNFEISGPEMGDFQAITHYDADSNLQWANIYTSSS